MIKLITYGLTRAFLLGLLLTALVLLPTLVKGQSIEFKPTFMLVGDTKKVVKIDSIGIDDASNNIFWRTSDGSFTTIWISSISEVETIGLQEKIAVETGSHKFFFLRNAKTREVTRCDIVRFDNEIISYK